MFSKKLVWRLYLPNLLITLLSLVVALCFAIWAIHDFYLDQLEDELAARARLVEREVHAALVQQREDLATICRELGRLATTRITLILPTGKVAADSEEQAQAMDNHLDRPEVLAALNGRTGVQIRYSHTLGRDMIYVAIPLEENGTIAGAVRTSIPLTTARHALRRVGGRILAVLLLVAMAAMAATFLLSRRISRPLQEMTKGARRFARGDLESRLIVPEGEELGGLAEAMNEMAAQLHGRIGEITQQRANQEAILSSMVEGVIAVNAQEEIISVNRAASRMLGLDAGKVIGRSIQGAVRRATLHQLVSKALSQKGKQSPLEDVLVETPEKRFLLARVTPLQGAGGEKIGALLVVNDVTQLKRLENVRRDFVANVSHELRTPITSIKGFVETLLEGAAESRPDTERFLKIISKQADQLNAIIEDLLLLSRIEQEGEAEAIILEEAKILDAVEAAIEVCSTKANEKRISLGLLGGEGAVGRINVPLLTQAVVNLLDNAVNFSEPGSTVMVRVAADAGLVSIQVEDQGCGIAPEYVPRLTERFYRVDKARSRKSGGTGLGLAIVKHIVQAHRGTLEIQSTPGRGSAFTIHLPRTESA